MNELPRRPVARILRADEASLWTEGFAFLQAAKDEAQRIRNDNEEWLQISRAEGFESGLQKGAEQVAQMLGQTSSQVENYLAGLETALVDLTLVIVRKVLGELDDDDLVVRCTRQALLAFRKDQFLTLSVPRAEAISVRQRILKEGPLSTILVEEDDSLSAGQARLNSPAGSVDLGLEAQLQSLRRCLLPFAEEGNA